LKKIGFNQISHAFKQIRESGWIYIIHQGYHETWGPWWINI